MGTHPHGQHAELLLASRIAGARNRREWGSMGTALAYSWSLPPVTVRLSVSVASDRGLVRAINEDSFLATPPIFLVADGMGGHAFGDRASQTAAGVLRNELSSELPLRPNAVIAALREANARVQEIGEEEFAGTTLAGLALVRDSDDGRPHWMAFNIGDSRIYQWHEGQLEQLSVDHSAVQELVDAGIITSDEAGRHPDRNIVTRAMGVSDDIVPDIWFLPAGGLQSFLICSDGLTKELDDAAIEILLATEDELVSPADRLVAAALAAGGADNVTVVVIESHLSDDRSDAGATPLVERLEETLPRFEGAR
jgi:serine/threonine protein phosphatase PrpC